MNDKKPLKGLDLPMSKQVAYAIGQLGWSTLISIVNLQLVFFYIPTIDSGIPTFISQVTFLVVLNVLAIIAASGRLLDAVTDPLIAAWSDRYDHPKGRRIPFLKWSAIPAALFCVLLFVPIVQGVSWLNILWLALMQAGFYVALTFYVTPYFALIPELGHDSNQRLNLSTWISITYALGIIIAAQVPVLGDVFAGALGVSKVTSLQYAIACLSGLAVIFMLVPAFLIDEKKYCDPVGNDPPDMKTAIKHAFSNQNFRYYVAADFAYFTGLTIVMTGLLYYITILLGLAPEMMGLLLPMMILLSFVFYPLVNILARKTGKKKWITGAFFWMALVFGATFFLGKWGIPAETQSYLLIFGMAIPISFLGILPNAVLADIAQADAEATGIRQEGMFFAARTLMQKFGQTFGVLIFAILTTFGKDVGDDLGIRLSGIVGMVLCLIAGIYFARYKEKL